MFQRAPRTKWHLVAMVLVVLGTVPQCTSFRREGGLFDQARARDIYEGEISRRCPMPYEDWEEYCYAPSEAGGIPDPEKCPDKCLIKRKR